MARTVGIGNQDYADLIENNAFYIDKTLFIKEWWENFDHVTLITRPRRFGKTLNMSMVEQFFSVDYAGRSDLFEKMNIWKEKKYRNMQGTYPVIAISFANIKETTFLSARKSICHTIKRVFNKFDFLLDSGCLNEYEKGIFQKISPEMEDYIAADAIRSLSDYLKRYYGRKPIILLDEYDTPMQEAYVNGYWDEMAEFVRNIFNSAFKTNAFCDRAIINFLDEKKLAAYWANTSSNSLVGKLIREGSKDVKIIMESLLTGGVLRTKIDEQIIFDQLDHNEYAIWSLLLASGYLKVEEHTMDAGTGKEGIDRIVWRCPVDGSDRTALLVRKKIQFFEKSPCQKGFHHVYYSLLWHDSCEA